MVIHTETLNNTNTQDLLCRKFVSRGGAPPPPFKPLPPPSPPDMPDDGSDPGDDSDGVDDGDDAGDDGGKLGDKSACGDLPRSMLPAIASGLLESAKTAAPLFGPGGIWCKEAVRFLKLLCSTCQAMRSIFL